MSLIIGGFIIIVLLFADVDVEEYVEVGLFDYFCLIFLNLDENLVLEFVFVLFFVVLVDDFEFFLLSKIDSGWWFCLDFA